MRRRRASAARASLGILLVSSAGACELTEVSLADARDVVVVEILLRTDGTDQTAFLHRTLGSGTDLAVSGARVEVRDEEAGSTHAFTETSIELCVEDADAQSPDGTCYRTSGSSFTPRPGSRYALRIELPGGGLLESETVVPGDFEVRRPTPTVCHLDADRTIELSWSRSAGSWVYVSEAKMTGLQAALRARGVELSKEPARFIGLSVGAQDTTLAFPSELGVFDRADADLTDALVAIRDGLPPNVSAEITVAAGDRNYVNWVRGGQFNPSGLVQVPSVRGAGTGVFGSMVVRRATMMTSGSSLPACR